MQTCKSGIEDLNHFINCGHPQHKTLKRAFQDATGIYPGFIPINMGIAEKPRPWVLNEEETKLQSVETRKILSGEIPSELKTWISSLVPLDFSPKEGNTHQKPKKYFSKNAQNDRPSTINALAVNFCRIITDHFRTKWQLRTSTLFKHAKSEIDKMEQIRQIINNKTNTLQHEN
jgi:hypothetical protein